MKAGTAYGTVVVVALTGAALVSGNGMASAVAQTTVNRSGGFGQSARTLARSENLPSLVRAARTDFRSVTEHQVDEARDRLQTALSALNDFLDQNPAVRDGWVRYLRLNDLKQQLTPGVSPDPEQLRRIRGRFAGGHAGLERDKLTAVRAALEAYAQVLEDRGNQALEQDYRSQLDRLAQAIEAYRDDPRQETLQQVIGPLSWLERRGQAESAVRAVRRVLSRPNLFLQLSEKAVATLVYAPIDETERVRDVVLGTHIRGTGRTVGHVTASVVPDDKVGKVRVAMIATNSSKTVGYSDPVRICQDNCTKFLGWKTVIVDREGIRSLPAVSRVSTESDLTGLGTTLRGGLMDRLVRRKAYQRFYAQEDTANRIVESRQRLRFNQRLDGDVDVRLAKGNRLLKQEFFKPLKRYDVFPRQFDTRSTSDQLQVSLQFCSAVQLGAANDPPPLAAATDLSVRAHQSTFNNLAADVLAGRVLTVDDIKQMAGATVDRGESGAASADDRLTVTLTRVQPVTVRIDDGVVAVTFRGQRFVVGNRGYPPMNVTIRYQLEPIDGGMRARRVGELDVVPPDIAAGVRQRYSMRERALQRLMRNRLDRELEQEYVRDGVTLEGELNALGRLRIAQLVADDGWLTVACQRARSAAVPSE
jgi:hypothetical protein